MPKTSNVSAYAEDLEDDEDFETSGFLNDFADNEEMIDAFEQMASVSGKHMDIACQLTKTIVKAQEGQAHSTQAVLDIFKQSLDTVINTSPMKGLLEYMDTSK